MLTLLCNVVVQHKCDVVNVVDTTQRAQHYNTQEYTTMLRMFKMTNKKKELSAQQQLVVYM